MINVSFRATAQLTKQQSTYTELGLMLGLRRGRCIISRILTLTWKIRLCWFERGKSEGDGLLPVVPGGTRATNEQRTCIGVLSEERLVNPTISLK